MNPAAVNFWRRISLSTKSNAFRKSVSTCEPLSTAFVTYVQKNNKFVLVDRPLLKPCWALVSRLLIWNLISSYINDTNNLPNTQSYSLELVLRNSPEFPHLWISATSKTYIINIMQGLVPSDNPLQYTVVCHSVPQNDLVSYFLKQSQYLCSLSNLYIQDYIGL